MNKLTQKELEKAEAETLQGRLYEFNDSLNVLGKEIVVSLKPILSKLVRFVEENQYTSGVLIGIVIGIVFGVTILFK